MSLSLSLSQTVLVVPYILLNEEEEPEEPEAPEKDFKLDAGMDRLRPVTVKTAVPKRPARFTTRAWTMYR